MSTTQNQDPRQENRGQSTGPHAGNGDAFRQGTHELKQELKQDTEELRAKATDVAREATREGQAQVDQYRNVAAQKVDTIAESVKAAAAKLQEGDAGQWSAQIAGMADSMSRFSQGLREKSADEVMQDINRMARENPAIFVGSAVAIGFGLTRLMRATAQPRASRDEGRSRGASDATGTDDDAYTTSTITGDRNARLSGGAHGTSAGSAANAGSAGAMGTRPYGQSGGDTSASGYSIADAGNPRAPLAGSASQPAGSSAADGSQANGNNRSGGPTQPGGNDGSRSS